MLPNIENENISPKKLFIGFVLFILIAFSFHTYFTWTALEEFHGIVAIEQSGGRLTGLSWITLDTGKRIYADCPNVKTRTKVTVTKYMAKYEQDNYYACN